MFLENADQLKNIFGIDKISNIYEEYTPLIDRKVGFSVKRKYPPNIRYKPPTAEDGTVDVVALTHVVYDVFSEEANKKPKKDKVPIFISIAPHSKYLSNHFDYNFKDKNCPTEASVKESKSSPKPISLETMDEYVYDSISYTLKNSKGDTIAGEDILNMLFRQHCNTVHLFKGFSLRWKIGSRDNAIKLCDFLVQIGKYASEIFFGRKFEPEDAFSGSLSTYKKEDMKLLKTDSLDIFGYKASKNVIVTFCFLVFIGYFTAYTFPRKNQFVTDVMNNNLIMICASISLLWLLDHVFPVLVLWLINAFIKLKLKLIFIKIRT